MTTTDNGNLQQTVAQHYDKVWAEQEGESWESWPFFRQNPSALTFALDSLGKIRDKSVLDLACGIGYSSRELAGRGAQVYSLDLSAEGLRKTLARASQAGFGDKVRPVRSSVEQLPFADNSFDAVFAQNFLMHVAAAKVGQEVFRVLKPGGRAVFVEPLSHHPLVKLYRVLFSSYKGTRPRWSKREDLTELARPFGYSKTRIFYLSTAVTSLGFIQERPWLLKPAFRTLHTLDRAILKVAPKAEQFAWVSVTELVK